MSQQIKKHGLIDETIKFFYMIIQKFNSVIGVHFMILSPENAKLCEAMCEEIISHINETTLQVLNEESKFILIFIWGHVGGNYRNNSKWLNLKQTSKDLFDYGKIYDDVDCFLNVLKYFEKYHDLSEEQSNEIYSIIFNQYYQSKKKQEYYSESDDSDDSDKTNVINKGKQKEMIKKHNLSFFGKQKNALFIQKVITDKFKQIVQAIPNWKCDVVILDRTHFDQKYFINVLIQDENTKTYLFEEIKQIEFDLEQIYKVIYVRPSKEIIYQHQKKRQENIHLLEKYHEKYLSDIYNEHDNNIEAVYPNYVKIENNKHLCYFCSQYQNHKCADSYDFKYYIEFFDSLNI
ncbi:hypothetical protein C2G38_2204284 [Gigaspora rosea]|uniref:Uncharacterized protein n=1 Tax=Gigaspora rosea TaxID=44941 RepID=A0A397UUB4_9GLOM|nr:hypothetical protein C2G38_2204284 [Gigaspora rosea]